MAAVGSPEGVVDRRGGFNQNGRPEWNGGRLRRRVLGPEHRFFQLVGRWPDVRDRRLLQRGVHIRRVARRHSLDRRRLCADEDPLHPLGSSRAHIRPRGPIRSATSGRTLPRSARSLAFAATRHSKHLQRVTRASAGK